jgi:LAO/AO transport system kinase
LSRAFSIQQLKDRMLAGDRRALARAASLIEAQKPEARGLLAALFPLTGKAKMIGITGPPGAGKSTLVSQLAKAIRNQNQTVGIVAVDPSSPYSRGALLGDRIRMQEHHADAGVFIRSMATRGKLGGLATATLEMALLLDAARRDFVLIETVGVGQDEVEITHLADVTVLVLTPGMGDDVQAIKAGIMEIADVFLINKADLPGVDQLEQEIRAMQSLGDSTARAEAAPVLRVTASQGQGIDALLAVINQQFEKKARASRPQTWNFRLREMLRERISSAIPSNAVEEHAARVAERAEDPYAAVEALFSTTMDAARK